MVAYLLCIYLTKTDTLYPGEQITICQHMLQCASRAEAQGECDHVIVAALLHDVGHLISESNQLPGEQSQSGQSQASKPNVNLGHEGAGAAFLSGYFPAAVIDAIRLHVEAKRYLCTVEPGYIDGLSPASAGTLSGQGGLMSAAEIQQFKEMPHLETVLKVRRLDDVANAADFEHPEFKRYLPAIRRVMSSTV